MESGEWYKNLRFIPKFMAKKQEDMTYTKVKTKKPVKKAKKK